MNLASKILSDITVFSKYSRFLPDEGRREMWDEIVARNMNMHIKKYPALEEEIRKNYKLVYEKKVLPSMRALQFSGAPIELMPSRQNNCSYVCVNDYRVFGEIMHLLLGGSGVGYGIHKQHVQQLPPIQKPSKSRRYLISDSIDGWADAVKALMKAYMCGNTFPDFDFRDIRSKGSLLKTSGGVAPGPEPLKECLFNICKVLDRVNDGDKLQTIDVHDIICYIAAGVLSGGIRRSSCIALFDPDDYSMLTCKYNSWWEKNPQRALANNSVTFLRSETTKEDFDNVWSRIKESGSGEPGIFWTNDDTNTIGINPCQPSSATVISSDGFSTDIGSISVGDRILSSSGLTTVLAKTMTGVKSVYRYSTCSGEFVGTDNHRIIENESKVEVKDAKCIDAIDGSTNKILSVEYLGDYKVFSLTVDNDSHTYFTGGCNVSNCGEVSLKTVHTSGAVGGSFCVSGDTEVITKCGMHQIKDIVGKQVEIWNGEKWSKVSPYKTGNNDKLYRVYLNDGSYLDATSNHKFIVRRDSGSDFMEMDTVDLIKWFSERRGRKSYLQTPRTDIKYDTGEHVKYAYEYGFFLGDGCMKSPQSTPYADLYGAKRKIRLNGKIHDKEHFSYTGTPYDTIVFNTLNNEFCYRLKYAHGLPRELFAWDRESIINFISGWMDADGSKASHGARIYGSEDKIRHAQLLLSKVGIRCSINLMQRAGVFTNLCIRKSDVWYIQITKTIELRCQRVICNNPNNAFAKGKYQIIKGVRELPGTHESYCLTENELHQCLFNNVLTKQCNLSTLCAADITTQEELNKRARVAAFIGTLQAGYTDFHYIRHGWQKITEEDALIGVSMTGVASSSVLGLSLPDASAVVLSENERVAQLIGINPAARATCNKPDGTSSCVLGSSSGVHPWHSKTYIRRMRLNKEEPIYKYIADKIPELVEDDFLKSQTQAVLSLPQMAPEGAITRDESTSSMLDRVKKFNVEWVRNGHRSGVNCHSVSATVSIRDNEWDKVGKWMWNNREFYNGITVLPYSGHTYKQAPFEECDEETYNNMLKKLHKIDLTQVKETSDNTKLKENVACAGGKCELH